MTRAHDVSRPVFILGPARSGTTLVYKALCLHPAASWFSQYARRAPATRSVSVLNRIVPLTPRLRDRTWFGSDDGNAYVYGRRRSLLDRAYPAPVEAEPVYRSCGVPEGEVDSAIPMQRAALQRAFRELLRWSGGEVVVSKRIANNRRVGLLADAFPEARFVLVVRDGRAVAASLARVDWWDDHHVWWYGGTPRQWRESGGDPWECCARNWVEELAAIERGLARVDEQRVFRTTYESLVASPIEVLNSAVRFAGLGQSQRFEREVRSLRFPDRSRGWETILGDDALGVVESVQLPTLVRHGYLC